MTVRDTLRSSRAAVLALDLGRATGWAFLEWGEVAISRPLFLPVDDGRAMVALRKRIRELIRKHRPDVIAYEDVPAQAHTGGDAAHLWGAWYGCVMLVCRETGTPYLGVLPAQWKAAAGLLSASGPADALRAARARWPALGEGATEDEAVARWVAVAAAGRMG